MGKVGRWGKKRIKNSQRPIMLAAELVTEWFLSFGMSEGAFELVSYCALREMQLGTTCGEEQDGLVVMVGVLFDIVFR